MAPNRARKNTISAPPAHLQVIPGGPPGGRASSRLVWKFLLVFVSCLGGLLFYALERPDGIHLANKRFQSLHAIYLEEGMNRFQEEKQRLKAQITKALNDPQSEEEQNYATNVAVYLFPDVLPNASFEKSVAQEQWGTFQEAIEKKPRSPESRIWFDELRANIWNYESPDRQNPKLSPYAKETLKIYDGMSSP